MVLLTSSIYEDNKNKSKHLKLYKLMKVGKDCFQK